MLEELHNEMEGHQHLADEYWKDFSVEPYAFDLADEAENQGMWVGWYKSRIDDISELIEPGSTDRYLDFVFSRHIKKELSTENYRRV